MVVSVFAVDDRTVQLHWPRAVGHVELSNTGDDGARRIVWSGGGHGPQAVTIDDLDASTRYEVTVDRRVVAAVTTSASLTGGERSRIATLSDIHIGERHFGHLPRIHDRGAINHAILCLRSALAEINHWGAELLVLKGDLAHDNRQRQYEVLAEELATCPIEIIAVPGNHDGGNHRRDDITILRSAGITVVDDIVVRDLPGIRLVVASTLRPGHYLGSLEHLAVIVNAVAAVSPSPVLVMLHHQLAPVLTYWPAGIIGRSARTMIDSLRSANPNVMVTSGHTHRNRRRDHGRLVTSEVGSPKDYPGTWAGYRIASGSMRQVVLRISDPAAMAWTQRTASTVMGSWGRWSPGTLDDRCFTVTWDHPDGSSPVSST